MKKGELFFSRSVDLINPREKTKRFLTSDPPRSTSGATPSAAAACSTAASNASIPCGAPNPRKAVLDVELVLATRPRARSLFDETP